MAYTVTVTNRLVNDDGSIQYQMDDGWGVVFADASGEASWCNDAEIEELLLPIARRIAACKTVDYGHNATVSVDINEIAGLILRSS